MFFAIRLMPGDDLRGSLEGWCSNEDIDAAALISLVGSLESTEIRMAGEEKPRRLEGPFEIVSATGTLSKDGIHVHLAIADGNGKVVAGHLCKGCKVNTTVEASAINFSQEWQFKRLPDEHTGSLELNCIRKAEQK